MDICEFRARYFSVSYVISCALNGIVPVPEGLKSEGIYNYSSSHSLGALTAHALERAGKLPQQAAGVKFKAARKIMLFDAARAELASLFEAEKIRYMPLKGVILKELYPEIGLREMSDNDILIDEGERAKVRDIMLSLGYTVESYGKHHHDVYVKEPVYNFEIHVTLFSITKDRFHRYFASAFDRAYSTEESPCEYKMTDEDFYIYVKAHEYKHYTAGGIGLRALTDTYVFLKAKEGTLNFDYIESECDKLGILEYEKLSRSLSMKLFSPTELEKLHQGKPELSDEELEMFDYIASSGTYGKISTQVENAMKRYEEENVVGFAAKVKFLWRRVFPQMSFYKENAPFVYKYKIFIPFYCIGRLVVALIRQPGRIFAQIKSVLKYKKK